MSKAAAVKKVLKEIKIKYGADKDKDTPLPVEMFRRALMKLAARKRLLATRDVLALVMEFQGGARVGELTGRCTHCSWDSIATSSRTAWRRGSTTARPPRQQSS